MLDWRWHKFSDLVLEQLYELLALRSQVFVVEQRCFYQDLDGKDQAAHHLLGYYNQTLQAYLRCYAIDAHRVSIGRVIISPAQRQRGIGKMLMQQAIEFCQMHYPTHTITINAQHRLINFYQKLQFVTCGEPFEQAGIMHVHMERST